jgi:hypothetical protein
MANIVGYNWNGSPIYGLDEVKITPAKTNKIDVNNLINQVPGTLSALSGLFGRNQQPQFIPQPQPNGFNNGGGGNMLYIIGGIVLLMVVVFAIKK